MLQFFEQVPLAENCTLRVGGPAAFFTILRSIQELPEIWAFAQEKKIPIFWLGAGSNLLFADAGFPGLVVKNELKGLSLKDNFLTALAGEPLANLGRILAAQNLTGVAELAGVPGTVGGALAGNANNLGKFLVSAKVICLTEKFSRKPRSEIWDQEQCQFQYRFSAFKNSPNFILQAKFHFPAAQQPSDLKQLIQAKMQKQPFLRTSGSWFKNPPQQQAWSLIQAVGGPGLTIGKARISKLHANFFENLGGARASDFLQLEKLIQARVWQKFQIKLEREVVLVVGR